MRVALLLGALLCSGVAEAQEIEPRLFWPSPVGVKVVLAGFGGAKGAVLLDPTVDIEHVEADVRIITLGAGYTLGIAGRQARVLVIAPIAWGDVTADIRSQPQTQELSGFVDPRIRLSYGVIGAPALTPAEFATARRTTSVGTSITVVPPLGQYDSSQPINLGHNRWGFKPELTVSHPIGRWTIDGAAGVWWFTANTAFFPGATRKTQDPIGSVFAHVCYALPSRIWFGVDGTWFGGGQTHVGPIDIEDRQRNTRVGATVSVPIARSQALKLIYSNGTSTRRGTDFDTLSLTWQLAFL